jgi:hypothetical protein
MATKGRGRSAVSDSAETGSHKVTRSDIFLVNAKALVLDWRKNLSRNGEEPPVDDALIGPVPRTIKQLRSLLETRSGPANPGHRLASYLLDYLAGMKSDDRMVRYWDKALPDNG